MIILIKNRKNKYYTIIYGILLNCYYGFNNILFSFFK